MNDPYAWIMEFYEQALEEGRDVKLVLLHLLQQAEGLSNENPDERIALCDQGAALAHQLGEPWWAALFEYWKGEITLYYKHDPEAALRIAAALVVETRKPLFDAFPQRVAIHLNFIASYSKIDPIGYAPQIRAALASDEAEWDRYDSFYPVYWQLRTRFLTAVGDSQAVEIAYQHFAYSCDFHASGEHSGSHYIIYALVDLLQALHGFDPQGARDQTADLAEMGDKLSNQEGNERVSAILTMWRAGGERYAGRETEAKRFYLRAMQKQAALSPPRNAVFKPALAFHEIGGENEKVLEICDAAIEVAMQHAHWFDAVTYLAQKCETKRDLGQNWDEDAARLREIAAKLPSKAHWEAQIERWKSA